MPQSPARRLAAILVFGLAGLLFQAAVLLVATLFGRLFPQPSGVPEDRALERVVVRMADQIATPVADEPDPAAVEPVLPAPEEQVVLETRPRPVEAPVLKPPEPRAQPGPPADPVDLDRPWPEPSAEPRRRVVGISLESTVEGGGGPAFAVGNTRMGLTGDLADDPAGVGRLGPADRGTPGAKSGDAPVAVNRTSSLVPVAGAEVIKPVRLAAVEPRYPPQLQAQGIEGNVGMMIRVSVEGAVEDAKVVKSSGYPEFDRAAREAALMERFTPATRDGRPIEYTLRYTYRFRIKGA